MDAPHYSGTGLGSKLALHHAFLMSSKLRCEIQTEIVAKIKISMNGVAVELKLVALEQLLCGKFLYSTALLLLRFHLIKFNIAVSPVLQVFPNFETVYRICDRLAGRMFPT
ncbi:hypothetical protein [Collimonas silvisoli]|uniref:hypothetical protein n=1 Tax=Collimonas silvisoli TaxID=2825884 RepID=UPI001B8B2237|nr:hypothetical protein [Collimonas silvisoli]